jgi:DNA-directed RNA polymerase III subunit RPC2
MEAISNRKKSILTSPVKTLNDKYALLPAFLNTRGLIRHHIESFNDFVNYGMQNIILSKENNMVSSNFDPNYYIKYSSISVGEPYLEDNNTLRKITPQLCRQRCATYAAPITAKMEYIGTKSIKKRDVAEGAVYIGRLPIILKSDLCILNGISDLEMATLEECPLDPGGYFIIQGTEKVVLFQEQFAKNRLNLSLDSNNMPSISVSCSKNKSLSKNSLYFRKGRIYVKLNSSGKDVPLIVIIKALGIESDLEIMQMVGDDIRLYDLIIPSILECKNLGIKTTYQALNWVGVQFQTTNNKSKTQGLKNSVEINRVKNKFRVNYIDEAIKILMNLFLVHVPAVRYNMKKKTYFLAFMVQKMLSTIVHPTMVLDNMDYYGNKQVESTGEMLSILFEDLIKRLNSDLSRQFDSQMNKYKYVVPFDIIKKIRSDIITYGFESSILSGNWTIKRYKIERKGVTQVLSRLSFISTLSVMTRINSQIEKTRKLQGPRNLIASQWGILCPCDTPEGESCGLVKNFAILSKLSTEVDEQPIFYQAIAIGVQPIIQFIFRESNSNYNTAIFLNGVIIGIHVRPHQFLLKMRKLRRIGFLGNCVNIFGGNNKINIASNEGRLCRPLIICDSGIPRLSNVHIQALKNGKIAVRELLITGFIEYLDVDEENDSLIAINESECNKYTTHLEIEPLTILGLVAGLIPFPHHNQSPRNTYQCAMGKQALGNIAYNQLQRMDVLLHLLCLTQKPLLTTQTIKSIGFEKLGAGQNAIVAVMSYSGYDIEDAIIINKASIDRGFGRSLVMKTFSTSIKKYLNRTTDRIVSPNTKYRKLGPIDLDGLANPGESILPGDIYVNRQVPCNTREPMNRFVELSNSSFRPAPMIWKGQHSDRCIIDKVILTTSETDHLIIKTLIRNTRKPELGDKFSSRHGQKGVLGNVVSQEDMPYSAWGVCPDLVMNPHGLPSRMTVGNMIELIGSKAAALTGNQLCGDAFVKTSGSTDTVETISRILIKKGFSFNGKENLMSGLTGEPLTAYVFKGPVYYQKLKHMVSDKIHVRSRGPKIFLTRQPTEGRSRGGALRLGEMERECLLSYGAAMLINERLMVSSDQFVTYVCTDCKILSYWHHKLRRGLCPHCKKGNNVVKVQMPYACKLMIQELHSMNLLPRLSLTNT